MRFRIQNQKGEMMPDCPENSAPPKLWQTLLLLAFVTGGILYCLSARADELVIPDGADCIWQLCPTEASGRVTCFGRASGTYDDVARFVAENAGRPDGVLPHTVCRIGARPPAAKK